MSMLGRTHKSRSSLSLVLKFISRVLSYDKSASLVRVSRQEISRLLFNPNVRYCSQEPVTESYPKPAKSTASL